MKHAHTLNVLPTEDDRNVIPDWNKGVYFVHKKNLIAQFPWNNGSDFDTAYQANLALKYFLQSRKDSDKLTVTLIKR